MTDAQDEDPNIQMLDAMVGILGNLADDLVFVGGCATGLLVTALRAQSVRVTNDVDVVTEATTVAQYHAIEARLRNAGFLPDPEVICRWRASGLQLDLMPSAPEVLGFANRWYPRALSTAINRALPSGRMIRHIAGPEFLATKFEAFKDRGNSDYLASHDLEDVITVLDGRDEIEYEIASTTGEIKSYITGVLSRLMTIDAFMTALPGHLPGDAASQGRLPQLMGRLHRIARL